MGFPRQEYWSGLPFPPPGDLPKPRIKPVSPEAPELQADFFFLNRWAMVEAQLTQALKKPQALCSELYVFLTHLVTTTVL